MGDIAIDIFQETLKALITSSKLSLIVEEKHQLQSLEEEIKYLRGFLKVTEKKRNDHSEVMNLVKQIKDLIAEAENIIELFVVHAFKADHASNSLREHQDHLPIKTKKKKGKKKNNKRHHKQIRDLVAEAENIVELFVDHAFQADHAPYLLISRDLETVKKGMKNLTAEVKKIYDENMDDINGVAVKQLKHCSTGIRGGSGSSRGSNTSKVIKEKVVVGFEEEVNKLIDKLDDKGKGRPLEIISIIGPDGGGKTTLAREVYDHPFTSYTFEIRAWIDVSQDYNTTWKRDLLIRILESVTRRDCENISDDKLGEDVLKCLKGKKYLIVMDDIWGIEAWNDIQRSFPKECKGSKVLFTSRLLVQLDSVGYFPHYLAPLPKNWCWELLHKKVFGMKCCPLELVDIGEQIAEKCKGLPLAVVTIAGFLATEDKRLDVWEKVAKHLSSIIAKNHEGCMEILELSYNHLPLHLKACFLYIGGYPEDKVITIRELIWLWIAEGFIQQSEGEKSLETIAEGYLNDLINRSLVQVARKSSLGGTKACRIHDLLRELCLKKAEDDNFLVKVDEYDSFSPSATNKHRRLFIGDYKFFQKLSVMPQNLRSFLCLRLQEKDRPTVEKYRPLEVQNFKLLRVLHVLTSSCNGVQGIRHLVHLRYLAISDIYRFRATPFSYLLNLETLNMHLTGGVDIKLPHDIFKMVKLRHLYTESGVFTFHNSSKETGGNDFERSSTLDNLQTFHKVCVCEACQCFLVRTPNLRKLGLYARRIPNDIVLRFPDLEFLKCLEKLTFTSNVSRKSVGRTLPPGLKLPLTITRITLKYTHLKWEELSLLQTLPNLGVLKLLRYACAGPVWDASELEGFPQLKCLKFNKLDIEEWNASEDQFPKFEVLVIERCYKLKQIPIAFGNLNELREIKLLRCTRSVEESARQIREGQTNRIGDDDCLNLIAIGTWP